MMRCLVVIAFCLPAFGAELADYKAVMWVSDSAYRKPEKFPLFLKRLREMGINTGMVHGEAEADLYQTNHFPYYVENMVNKGLCMKFNSKYSDWDRFVTDWARNGRGQDELARQYCFDDPKYQAWARAQMQRLTKKHAANSPVLYDIRDELSVTISANPFDFDFTPQALENFRNWLQTHYGSLEALNAEWETKVSSWGAVMPFTTDEIKNRMATGDAIPKGKPDWQAVQHLKFNPSTAGEQPTRWNFSPWADFRTYMDISLSRTLAAIRAAAREIDPKTPVGIEGTQMPNAFGGYDLWRLSQAVDWVEPYDIGNAREIFGSFMPNAHFMTTVFEKDSSPARRRLWHLLLEGDKGCLVWWSEDCINWQSENYDLTPKAKALAPVLKEMNSPLARLFRQATKMRDPIAIHYSQASIQADWLLESTVDGSTWLRRFSSFEANHNRMLTVRNSWLKLFQDAGYSPRFVSTEQIEQGELKRGGYSALVLPESLALSAKEAAAIREFAAEKGRVVFADGIPGLFDEHGKLRAKSPLADLFASGASEAVSSVAGDGAKKAELRRNIADYARERLRENPSREWNDWLAGQLPRLDTAVSLSKGDRVRTHGYTAGSARLFAFERGINYQMSEDLKQAGGNQELEKRVHVRAQLRKPGHVYDLRSGEYLGEAGTWEFELDPWQPSFFAVVPNKVSGAIIEALESADAHAN